MDVAVDPDRAPVRDGAITIYLRCPECSAHLVLVVAFGADQ